MYDVLNVPKDLSMYMTRTHGSYKSPVGCTRKTKDIKVV